jgi:hypothetical protein
MEGTYRLSMGIRSLGPPFIPFEAVPRTFPAIPDPAGPSCMSGSKEGFIVASGKGALISSFSVEYVGFRGYLLFTCWHS